MKHIGDGLSFFSIFAIWFATYCIIGAPEAMAADSSPTMAKGDYWLAGFMLSLAMLVVILIYRQAVREGDEQRRIDRREYDEANGHEHH